MVARATPGAGWVGGCGGEGRGVYARVRIFDACFYEVLLFLRLRTIIST